MIRLALFDMDGTIVRYESSSFHSSWDAIGEAAGLKPEWDRMLAHYYPRSNDAGTYREWFDANCRMLAGKKVQPILEKIFPPPYAPGFKECCVLLKAHHVTLGLISSGVDLVAQRIQEDVGLDFYVANGLEMDDDEFTGIGDLVVDLTAKGREVRQALEHYCVSKEETAYFGDHENDIPAWKEVGWPIGINLKKENCYPHVKAYFPDFVGVPEFLAKQFK